MYEKKKKILIISVMNSWGGGEEFILRLVKNLPEYEFYIASTQNEVSRRFRDEGLNIFQVSSLKKFYRESAGWSLLITLKTLFNVKISSLRLTQIILKNKIDLIIANGNFAGLYALPASFLSGRKFIGIQHLIQRQNSIEEKIIRLLNKRISKFVAVSNPVKENLKELIGNYTDEKIAVINNGIDLPEKIQSEKSKQINIGIVGSIVRLKGIDLIINAAKELIKNNRDIHLKIYGNTRERDSEIYFDELKSQIRESDLDWNVHFFSFEKDKDKLYSGFDILVSFSAVPESFSYSVLEAMSYGKIVIASDVGGPKEFLSDGINGFLVKPGDVKALSDKLKYCIDNLPRDKFSKIRNNARKTVAEKYSVKSFADGYKKFFDSIF